MSYLILGPLEVREDETEVAVSGGQQRKLLAILLLHSSEAVPSDRLIDELWHGEPPDTAAKALQGYVSSLRKQLGQDTIETIGSNYRLTVSDGDVDAHRFEGLLAEARPLDRGPAAAKLREALALWRGPALADFAYEDFAQHEIERLEELRSTGIERRIDLELALGHHVDLVPELEALVRAHPLRERLRGHLMVALYRSGRQAEALDVYRDARTVLHDELGLEPSEELQELQRAILDHDPSLAAPTRVEPPAPAGDGTVPTARRSRHPLLVAAVGLAILAGTAVAVALTLETGPTVVPPDSVAMINQAGTRIQRITKKVGTEPVAVAVGTGVARGVWVANAVDETVARLDPETGGPMAPPIGIGAELSDIAVGRSAVWVAGGNDGTVTRIDPSPLVKTTIAPPGGQQTIGPDPVFFVAVGSGYVWATRGSELLRIDPSNDHAVPVLNVGSPTGLATGGGSVWVTTVSEKLLRIDPKGRQTGLWDCGGGVISPAYARGSVWLICQGKIQQIDPSTLQPRGTLTVADGEATSLAAGGGTLWALGSEGALTRFGPDGKVTSLQLLGKRPSGAWLADAAAGDAIWVAVSETG